MKIVALSFLFLGLTLNMVIGNSEQPIRRKRSSVILKESKVIHVDLSISVRSTKEIIATVIFTNTSQQTFLLYRPILPNDTLVENDFIIRDSKAKLVSHIKSNSRQKYIGDSSSFDLMPRIVIPEVIPENFLSLNAGHSLTFKMNLAQHYRLFKKGTYSASFIIFMPLINSNMKQVQEKDSIDDKVKPVYLIIESGLNQFADKIEKVKFIVEK